MSAITIMLAALLVQSAPPPAAIPQEQPVSNDIVVTALPDIDAEDSLVSKQTLGSARTGSAVGSRTVFDRAQLWAKCASEPASPTRIAYLRQIFGTRTNSTKQAFAFQRLAQLTLACAPDPQAALGGRITGNPYYDRGALTIEVMKRIDPRLTLTRKQTGDPVVQARFNARETPLAKFRLPVDMRYFETAVCFVRLQPELSMQLALTDKPLDTVRRLEAAIVNRAKICVGNARRVYFDGVQFRFYIADAAYRWTLATRGIDSLLPE